MGGEHQPPIINLPINNEDRLKGAIDIIFEKVIEINYFLFAFFFLIII